MPTWEDLQRAAAETTESQAEGGEQLVAVSDPDFTHGIDAATGELPVTSSGLTPPQQRALETFQSRASLIVNEARALSVTDQVSLEVAAKFRQDLKAATDLFEALMRPEINRYYQAHKEALARLKQLLTPWTTADSIVKGAQDVYHLKERKAREEAARQLEAQMRRAREEELARQLEAAQEAQAPELVEEVLERAMTPAPVIPVVHTTTKAEGSSARVVHEFDLVDVEKVDPRFVMDAIRAEIGRTGRCEWLLSQIRREVVLRGKEAERTVGEGAIRYREGMSTGVRRKK